MPDSKNRKTPVPVSGRKWVTDDELAAYLGVCRVTARKIAENAGAVYRIGGLRRTNLNMIDESAVIYND